jgi:ABC-2 type transport system permease protein
MTAAPATFAPSVPQPLRRPGVYWAFADTWELFKRTVTQIFRTPGQLVTLVILQPVLLIVLFRYVFGGAVNTGQSNYANYLIPGIFAMNSVLVATVASVAVANDMSSGLIDRLRSLPMVKSAILGGTILANAARCLAALAAMVAVGYAVGFRPSAGLGRWLAAVGLLVLVSYSFSWLLGALGLVAGSVEGAQQMGALVWPFTFVSSAFVPAQSMPGWLRGFADNQPVTEAIDATRTLLLGQPVSNHVVVTLIWCAGITITGVMLAGVLFRRKFN